VCLCFLRETDFVVECLLCFLKLIFGCVFVSVIFFLFPETDLVEGFLWFSERNRFWVVVVGEILLLGCVVLVLWVFLVLGLLKS
jgi:hypothetical protein